MNGQVLSDLRVVVDEVRQVREVQPQLSLLVQPHLSRLDVLRVGQVLICEVDSLEHQLVSNGLRKTSDIPVSKDGLHFWSSRSRRNRLSHNLSWHWWIHEYHPWQIFLFWLKRLLLFHIFHLFSKISNYLVEVVDIHSLLLYRVFKLINLVLHHIVRLWLILDGLDYLDDLWLLLLLDNLLFLLLI
jgi:hypothetical protein